MTIPNMLMFSDDDKLHRFDTALGFVLDAVSETEAVEGEISLEIEPDGTQRLDVAIRSELKPYTPTTVVRESTEQ